MGSITAEFETCESEGQESRTEPCGKPSVDPNVGYEKLRVIEQQHPLSKQWRERGSKYSEYLEDITTDPRLEQERLLKHILKKNSGTQYLQQFALNGSADVNTFRKLVPVCEYDNIRPLVERIVAGEKSQILTADPVVEFYASSGTTEGVAKLYPVTEEDTSFRAISWRMRGPPLNSRLPGSDQGKFLFMVFVSPGWRTVGGLMQQSAGGSFLQSKYIRKRPFDPSFNLTSPDAVMAAGSYMESVYCHLICGLLQRKEVLRLGSMFSTALVGAFRNLEEWWPEICEDLAAGKLSETRVQTGFVRAAVQPYLRADPELAEFVKEECSKKSWNGIIRRLWPNCRVIDTVCTGSMSAYVPILYHYGDNLPVICSLLYGTSEGFFGVNLNPLSPPEEISYALIPTVAYYEFSPIAGGEEDGADNVVDLTGVKEGEEYEIIVTTVSGLYRCRVGDIVRVVGYYNATPVVQIVRRKNIVLSVDTDKTDETELLHGVTRAAKLLDDQLQLKLGEYTSTVDYSTAPAHYVIYMELLRDDNSDESTVDTIPSDILEQCCVSIEMSFNIIYRRNRAYRRISSLELRIVRNGTFQRFAELAFSRGASPTQYKPPRGLGDKHSAELEILADGLIQSHISQSCPPLPEDYAKAHPSVKHNNQ
ncbi:hypothetical protein R1sor_019565 [Riccia sorocarpa]|uniref:Uncharacterized protein n=1 Tax=Riccia sorocarpa TaxID=122646 RepID=A0ABD3ICV8_9MARC